MSQDTTQKKIEKVWNEGEKLYEEFCSLFPNVAVCTPRTNTLEVFVELKRRGLNNLLLKEFMNEFLSNLPDGEIWIKIK